MRAAWGRGAAAIVAVAVTLAATGCSSLYVPRTSHRLAASMEGGQIVYWRDGQKIRHGTLGAGLRTAVRGVPAAERAADEFHDRQVNGLLALGASLVCWVVGFTRMSIDLSNDEPGDEHTAFDGIAAGLFLGGAVLYGVGLYYIATAPPYMYDAINIYNDSVEGFVPQPPGGGSWVPPTN